MATLSAGAIANYAANAGFSGSNLRISIAVALAESSGRTTIVNYLGCVGLWQIYQAVHPELGMSINDLKNPSNNARAAYRIWRQQGWSRGWTTYSSGAYKRYLSAADKALKNRDNLKGTINKTTTAVASGKLAGGGSNVSSFSFDNTLSVGDIVLMGSKLKSNIKDAIISAEVSLSTDSVSQVKITLIDTDFKILKSGLFKPGTLMTIQKQRYIVASTDTSGTAGNETITVNSRPETVQKLKARTGTKVMKGASPSEFVKAECKALKAKYLIQDSPRRTQVARDLPEKGQRYEPDVRPSSWTTFGRLADELGYVVFEQSGTIYFGKPTWLLSKAKASAMYVTWNKGSDSTRAEKIPECAKSIDSRETTITVQLPNHRVKEAKPGRALKLSGVPTFDGYYLIKSADFSLSGPTTRLSVTAGTAIDPEAQPPTDGSTKSSSSSIAGSLNDGRAGSWPLPSKYHRVGTKFGARGSWAAGFHTGADLPCPEGTKVYAVYDGKIAGLNSWGSAYGKHIILQVSGGNRYGFCHLSKILVHSGQTVRSGQLIGYSGQTGRAFGPHLHLELRKKPYRYGTDARDPISTLMKKATSSSSKYNAGMSGTKKASDFVWWAQSRTGGRYVFGADRDPTDKNQTTFDCSSLVQWAAYRVGIKLPGSTFTQEPYLRGKGTKISIDSAYRTKGALLYRSTRGREHVAISLGNGRTIEAMSTSTGIVNASAKGRGWTAAYKVPGMRY